MFNQTIHAWRACTCAALLVLAGIGTAIAEPRMRTAAAGTETGAQAEVRNALRDYQQAWNRHDAAAWSAFLAEDVWFTQVRRDSYERPKGRASAVSLFKSSFHDTDLSVELLGSRLMPDGTVTVKLRHVLSYLPKTEGKYRIVFEELPAVGRWRQEEGRWKLFFFTSDKGLAIDTLNRDGLE